MSNGARLYAGALYALALSVVWGYVWREWSLSYDTAYPARVIFEHEFFTDEEGRPLPKVRAGQAVNYRKAFCVSLDDPDRLVDELKKGERGFYNAGDAVLEQQRGFFNVIYGKTRGQFVDGVALPIPDQTFEVQEGCYDITQRIVIPASLPPGLYYLQLKFTYYRNSFQKAAEQGVTRVAKPIYFEVVE